MPYPTRTLPNYANPHGPTIERGGPIIETLESCMGTGRAVSIEHESMSAPIVCTVDYVDANGAYANVTTTGVSHGGWQRRMSDERQIDGRLIRSVRTL